VKYEITHRSNGRFNVMFCVAAASGEGGSFVLLSDQICCRLPDMGEEVDIENLGSIPMRVRWRGGQFDFTECGSQVTQDHHD
jgi:hypothetical protein